MEYLSISGIDLAVLLRAMTICEKRYYGDISSFGLITRAEEKDLARKMKSGDLKARKKFVCSNVRLVITIAQKYRSADIEFSDLIQEGNVGLMYAIDRYDPQRSTRFAHYASWWIHYFIRKAVSCDSTVIHIPYKVAQKLKRKEQEEEFSNEPTINHERGKIIFSNDELLHYADNSYSPEKWYEREEKLALQNKLLRGLDKKERKIIADRFPLDGGKKKTLVVIGNELGISPEAVRGAVTRIIKKLYNTVKSETQLEFYY